MRTTDAIILGSKASGEADLLVTALTRDFIKIRLVAQGARKVGAKLKGHLEPLSLSRISFVAGRNNYRLTGAELLNFFPTVKKDLARLRVAAHIVSSLERALFEDHSDSGGDFFGLAKEALLFLNDPVHDEKDLGKMLTWFRVQFLRESGLFPDGPVEGVPYAPEMACPRFVSCAEFVSAHSESDAEKLEATASRIFDMHMPR